MPKKDEDTVLNTSREIRSEYEKRWPAGGVYLARCEDVPSLFCEQCSGLVAKSCLVPVIASGTSGGPIDYMFDFLRVDEKERTLKQHPAIIRFNGDVPAGSGCLRHHADFPGRDIRLSGDWTAFIGNQKGYLISGLPTLRSGLIADMNSPVLDAAFRYGVAKLSGCVVSG